MYTMRKFLNHKKKGYLQFCKLVMKSPTLDFSKKAQVNTKFLGNNLTQTLQDQRDLLDLIVSDETMRLVLYASKECPLDVRVNLAHKLHKKFGVTKKVQRSQHMAVTR